MFHLVNGKCQTWARGESLSSLEYIVYTMFSKQQKICILRYAEIKFIMPKQHCFVKTYLEFQEKHQQTGSNSNLLHKVNPLSFVPNMQNYINLDLRVSILKVQMMKPVGSVFPDYGKQTETHCHGLLLQLCQLGMIDLLRKR